MVKTAMGGTYWYGWSMLLPEDFDFKGSKTIVMQLATYPSPRNGRFPAGANGPFMHIDADGKMVFHLQHQGDDRDSVCDRTPIAGDVSKLRGRWIDFVMHARWTGDPDGFLRFWFRVGDEPYVQPIDYKGRTWWNDEDKGPYFKMGLYMGDPGWKGPPERTLYTDEYRLGDADSSFEEVAPPSPVKTSASLIGQSKGKANDNEKRGGVAPAARQWAVHEIALTAQGKYANPYTDVTVTATFAGPEGRKLTARGFWDGGAAFKVRFTPTAPGDWKYDITSSPADAGLTAAGSFRAAPAAPGDHGFVRRDPDHPLFWVRDDGHRYFMLGQTYYELVGNAAAGGGWKKAIEKCHEHGIS
jgi:hypothetical protein